MPRISTFLGFRGQHGSPRVALRRVSKGIAIDGEAIAPSAALRLERGAVADPTRAPRARLDPRIGPGLRRFDEYAHGNLRSTQREHCGLPWSPMNCRAQEPFESALSALTNLTYQCITTHI
jgi:hypothetical protein